ncbi:hypothetical protein WA158_003092 [Blastocystis sp. Blastoise]
MNKVLIHRASYCMASMSQRSIPFVYGTKQNTINCRYITTTKEEYAIAKNEKKLFDFCSGCGVQLQSDEPSKLGYCPENVFEEHKLNKKPLICQRCYQMVNYGRSKAEKLPDNVAPDMAKSFPYKRHSLVVVVLDILDIPGSIYDNIKSITSEYPVLVVINKCDVLPRGEPLNKLKRWARSILKNYINNLKEVIFVSSVSDYGVENTLAYFDQNEYKHIYITGLTNVGKSSFINRLLSASHTTIKPDILKALDKNMNVYINTPSKDIQENTKITNNNNDINNSNNKNSDTTNIAETINDNNKTINTNDNTNKEQPIIIHDQNSVSEFIQSNETVSKPIDESKLPATSFTVSPFPSTTLGLLAIPVKNKHYTLYDTPGFLPDSFKLMLINMLLDSSQRNIKNIFPRGQMLPTVITLHPKQSLVLGSLIKIDYDIQGEPYNLIGYIYSGLPSHILSTSTSIATIQKHIGKNYAPFEKKEQYDLIGGIQKQKHVQLNCLLQRGDMTSEPSSNHMKRFTSFADIALGPFGWISLFTQAPDGTSQKFSQLSDGYVIFNAVKGIDLSFRQPLISGIPKKFVRKKNQKSNMSFQNVGKNNKKQGQNKNSIEMIHNTQQKKQQLNQQPKKKLSMIEQMKEKLKGSKFRWINEQLYTQDGDKAFDMIHKDKGLFDTYHEGFRNQVEKWPVVPVDIFIKKLKKLTPKKDVGDFGCGDAYIYQKVKNHKIYSFDLISKKDYVIECDIAHVPRGDKSLDICIYCLSLMGTNWSDFIVEARRLLRDKGQLWIAEVRSRFDIEEIGGDEGFVSIIEQLGFKLMNKDISNDYFGVFYFVKMNNATTCDSSEIPSLKPCLYKKR